MNSQTTTLALIEQEKQIVQDLAGLPSTKQIAFNDSGWDSRVYDINNGAYFVKFPRSEKVQKRYRSQIEALKRAAAIGGPIRIPNVVWEHPDDAYFGYAGIPGSALAEIMPGLEADEKQAIGRALGDFLRHFHRLKLSGARDMSPLEEIKQLQNWYEKGTDLRQGLLTKAEQNKLHTLIYQTWPAELERLGSELALCHGDFHFNNIFYTNSHLGIIDFGDVCYADPSKDFINLDDPVILEAALVAYGDTSDAFREKITLRKAMLQIIKLTAQLAKKEAAAQGTLRSIKKIVAGQTAQ